MPIKGARGLSSSHPGQEATIRYAAAQYQRSSDAGVSGRDTECAAFNMINRELGTYADDKARLRALGRNHALWSILVKDLALSENTLPPTLKTELIGLGLWSMQYSTLAILQHLCVQPLIEVNRNIADGLMAQGGIGQTSTGVLKAALSI